jgi:hypothetical protein
MAYLRVEKPCFLFLEGSVGAKAMAVAATVAATVVPPDAPAARAGTSAARSASSVDRPAVGASAPDPGTCSSAASVALGEGGAGSDLSGGGACPPSLSFSSSSSDDKYSGIAGGESPCCSRSQNTSSLHSQRSRRRIARSFLRTTRSCSRRCATRARSGPGRGRVGPRCVHGNPLLGRTKRQSCGST